MYLDYYGLKEKPFDINTDPRFLWLGEKHKEAFSVLKYGVLENKGFLLLTGDVGAGKTTLIHALVESLGDDVIHATIPDPGLELIEFYKYMARAFGIENEFSTKADFIFIFREFLYNANEHGKKVLLIIDESQRLTSELLEEIRLLSNIELHTMKLLNIFFVGQVEFNTKLLETANRSVRQRITVSNHIQPLTEKETGDYIRHRLMVAGCKKNIFSFVAIHGIHQFSTGYPRLINILCDLALLTGYVKEVNKIGDDIIAECVESLNLEPEKQARNKSVDNKKTTKKENRPPAEFEPAGHEEEEPHKPLILKQNNWPKAALLYIVLLIAIIMAYFFYSDKIITLFKKPSPVTPSEPVHTEKMVEKEMPPVAQVSPPEPKPVVEQKNVFPLIEASLQNDTPTVPEPTTEVKPPSPELTSALPEKVIEENTLDTNQKGAHSNNLTEMSVLGDKVILDFKHNSNDFSDEDYETLEKVARYMKANPETYAMVIGYTDDMGTYSYNINLSSFRANIVKSYLAGKGIDIARIRATGLGPENPRASNSTPEGRSMNRRVEIEMMAKSFE